MFLLGCEGAMKNSVDTTKKLAQIEELLDEASSSPSIVFVSSAREYF